MMQVGVYFIHPTQSSLHFATLAQLALLHAAVLQQPIIPILRSQSLQVPEPDFKINHPTKNFGRNVPLQRGISHTN